MIESSSRIYSPYVFAIGQLIGEIPYSVVCGILYWVLMVRFRRWCRHVLLTAIKVYPMGYGHGSAGTNGTGFQLLIILFMLLFGVSCGQMVAALSPSVQVGRSSLWLIRELTKPHRSPFCSTLSLRSSLLLSVVLQFRTLLWASSGRRGYIN